MKNRSLHLSLLIFFQLGALGTYLPIITLYLKDYLGFSAIQTGVILSLSSLPSIFSPFITTFIADRVISSRKLLAICSVITSILIVVISFEKSYLGVLLTYFSYMIFLVPSLSLVHSLIFHFIEDRNSFAFIRSWGTVGWILTGWLISLIWNISGSQETLPLALRISALLSIIVVILTLKLPTITLNVTEKISIIPYETFKILKRPEVYLILIIVFLCSTVDKFVSYGAPIFLNMNGIPQKDMLIILSYGQIPEIVFLFLLTFVIKKIGINRIMIIAFLFQLSRLIIFYINGHLYLTIFGTLFHGFIYPLFYAPATIYLDKFTSNSTRSGLHQIYNLIFTGLAGLFGNYLAGVIASSFTINNTINFQIFWLIPGLITLFTFSLLIYYLRKYIS